MNQITKVSGLLLIMLISINKFSIAQKITLIENPSNLTWMNINMENQSFENIPPIVYKDKLYIYLKKLDINSSAFLVPFNGINFEAPVVLPENIELKYMSASRHILFMDKIFFVVEKKGGGEILVSFDGKIVKEESIVFQSIRSLKLIANKLYFLKTQENKPAELGYYDGGEFKFYASSVISGNVESIEGVIDNNIYAIKRDSSYNRKLIVHNGKDWSEVQHTNGGIVGKTYQLNNELYCSYQLPLKNSEFAQVNNNKISPIAIPNKDQSGYNRLFDENQVLVIDNQIYIASDKKLFSFAKGIFNELYDGNAGKIEAFTYAAIGSTKYFNIGDQYSSEPKFLQLNKGKSSVINSSPCSRISNNYSTKSTFYTTYYQNKSMILSFDGKICKTYENPDNGYGVLEIFSVFKDNLIVRYSSEKEGRGEGRLGLLKLEK